MSQMGDVIHLPEPWGNRKLADFRAFYGPDGHVWLLDMESPAEVVELIEVCGELEDGA